MAIETRGVFTLKEIYQDTRVGKSYPITEVYIASAESASNTGYVGGGLDTDGGTSSYIDKLDFSTDTMSPSPSTFLPTARWTMGANSSSTGGYFASGTPGRYSLVEKVNYSTDATARIPGADLSIPNALYGGASQSTSAGYYYGGNYPSVSPATVSVVEKINFAVETTSRLPSADLPTEKYNGAVIGNETDGYFAGGRQPAFKSSIEKLNYLSDTVAVLPSSTGELSDGRESMYAVGLDDVGYFMAGNDATLSLVSFVQKFNYSTNTCSSLPGGNLPDAKYQGAAVNDKVAGYAIGGSPGYSTTYKFTYSTETGSDVPGAYIQTTAAGGGAGRQLNSGTNARSFTLPTTVLGTESQLGTAIALAPNVGYFCGGSPADQTRIQKSDFTTETSSVLTSVLSTNRAYIGGVSTVENAYVGGGSASSDATIDKLVYSSETAALLPSATLSAGRYGSSGLSSPTSGYFGGGGSTPVSRVDKMSFASESIAQSPFSLSQNRTYGSSSSNQTSGYFAGGWIPGSASVSTVDKLVTSTDNVSRVNSADLLIPVHGAGACGNLNAAYFGGGYATSPAPTGNVSAVQKIAYSTDTTEIVTAAPLDQIRHYTAATGNNKTGYNAGGGSTTSSVSKIDYTTDTSSRNPGQDLINGVVGSVGVSGRDENLPQSPVPTPTAQTVFPVNYGYMNSQSTPSGITNYYKIAFSNETFDRIPSLYKLNPGTLTAANSSLTHSYLGGTGVSNLEKAEYVTDTNETIAGTLDAASISQMGATGNSTRGYFAGGNPSRSQVAKVTYSDDTVGNIPTAGFFAAGRNGFATIGNPTVGYFIGGQPGPVVTGDKLVYSTETRIALPSTADLSAARAYLGSLSNEKHGYTTGGTGAPFSPAIKNEVHRMAFSNETTTLLPGASLTATRYQMGTCGDKNVGYILGSRRPSPGPLSSVDKLSYATDTTSNVGNLDTPSRSPTGVSSLDGRISGNPIIC